MRNDFKEHVLEHSAKGTTWKNTKYLKKVMGANGKYTYFYTQAQLDAYNKTNKSGVNALSNEAKANLAKGAMDQDPVKKLAQGGMIAQGKTTAEKTASLKKAIATGSKAIANALSSSSKKSSKSSGSSKSSKSGSIAGKSKGSSGSSSKAAKGSSKEAKGKASSSKAAKDTTAKETTKKEVQKKAFDSAAAIKYMFGITDSKVNKHSSKDEMLKNMKTYDDGAYGYLTAKNSTYKWEKKNGEIKLIDINTDKEISIDQYLKDVSSIQEFRTDNIKRKSKFKK